MAKSEKSALGRFGLLAVAMVAVVSAVAMPAVAQQRRALAEGLAAVINDAPITSYDLNQRALFIIATTGAQITEETYRQALAQAMNALINEKLQLQEADRFKLTMTDEEADQYIGNQARQNGTSITEFFGQLAGIGMSPDAYRNRTRAEILWQRIVNGRFASRVRITPQRIDEVMEQTIANASKPQFAVSEIFLEVQDPSEMAATLAGAQTLITQMRQGVPFQTQAQEYSFAPTAASGGDMGWVTLSELRPEVVPVIEALQPGQVSNPIQVEGGVMIVGLRERRAGADIQPQFTLKEMFVALPADAPTADVERATARLVDARTNLRGCTNIDAIAGRANAEVLKIGEMQPAGLDEPYKSAVTNLAAGEASAPIRSDDGVHVMVACTRQMVGQDLPSRQDLEDHLFDQELSLIARRYLRDLRREATIITQ